MAPNTNYAVLYLFVKVTDFKFAEFSSFRFTEIPTPVFCRLADFGTFAVAILGCVDAAKL